MLRGDGRRAGRIGPSVAFLDDLTRCNLALFPQRFARGTVSLVETWFEVVLVAIGP